MGLKEITQESGKLPREDFVLAHNFYTTLPSDGSVVGIKLEETDDGITMMDSAGACYCLFNDVYNFSHSTMKERLAWYSEFQKISPKSLKD